MKKYIADLQAKSVGEINKDISAIIEEVAKLKIESKIKPQKDTNLIKKKEKQLAQMLTVITQKELGISK
ncbi:50S ribosomal protein L29 [Candidatus Woesebacteria bacterium]|nr:50S ribosomal protein L29 [Candidatus Woesebacteria bacterium]